MLSNTLQQGLSISIGRSFTRQINEALETIVVAQRLLDPGIETAINGKEITVHDGPVGKYSIFQD